MQIAPETFKAYDIRGIVPDQIDADAAEQVARAFAALIKPREVIVGRDVRLTGPEFRDRVVHGLTASGVEVLDIGRVSTDEFYYGCLEYDLPGIMITASHNPANYNGFKMVREMPTFVMAKDFKEWVVGKDYPNAATSGFVKEQSLTDDFVKKMIAMTDVASIMPLRVVIDTSNGSQGPIWEKLSAFLPIDIVPLNFEPDGRFPNHGNDIIQPDNQRQICEKVVEEEADLGLIFDPDGDRCIAIDNRGVALPGDFMTALLAVAQLDKHPHSTILYDTRASRAVPDMVRAAGGTPFMWKPGHAYIKAKMKEIGAVFGGEVSGHFYFKAFGLADSGILAGLSMLEYVSSLDGPLGEKIANLEQNYHLSGEINSTVADPQAVLQQIKERYHDGEINELSGVAVTYPDFRFVVRPSDNEPLVRLTLEASSRELMEQKRDELLAIIRG
jgi:phosphomannomutase